MKITITFDENSEAGRAIMRAIRSLSLAELKEGFEFVSAEEGENEYPTLTAEPAAVYECSSSITSLDEDDELDIPFERIPGLAYTHEERLAELRRAEKEFENGSPGTPHAEVMRRIRERIRSWK